MFFSKRLFVVAIIGAATILGLVLISLRGFGQPLDVKPVEREKIKYPQDFTIVLVGDSMTEGLGNSDEIKKYLSEYYPGKTFEVLNYGFGSTNILSVKPRILNETQYTRAFRPIAEIDYDLIILESFGQNPLSQYPLEEGLVKQREALDEIVETLKETNPRAKIVFMAAISPNKLLFASNKVDLSPETRAKWVEERIAYIKNHIEYAKSKGVPVINVFEASLMENGDGNPDFISKDDFIHLSPEGIKFTSRIMADFIFQRQLLQEQ